MRELIQPDAYMVKSVTIVSIVKYVTIVCEKLCMVKYVTIVCMVESVTIVTIVCKRLNFYVLCFYVYVSRVSYMVGSKILK